MTKQLIRELIDDATSSKVLSAISIGAVLGILLVILEVSFAAMVFSGDMAKLSTRAAGLTLCAGLFMCLISALTSSVRGIINIVQDAPTAVMSTVAVAVAAALGLEAGMEVKFMTMTAILFLSALLTAVAYLLIGKFKLANLLRFMPYPVVGGFLAGSGWLLSFGSIEVMCDVPLTLTNMSQIATMPVMIKWLPGVVFGVLLFAVLLKWSHFLILPIAMFGASILFYIGFFLADMPVTDAKAAGFLVTGVPAEGLFPAFSLADFSHVQWGAVLQQFPGILTVVLVSVVGMLLNMSGIEMASGRELDINKEFTSGGLSNLAAAFSGSMPGYPSISLTVLGLKTGADSRLTGLIAAGVIGGVLFFGGMLLEYFPKPLLGGLLLLLGLFFIYDWIVTTAKRLPLPDYLIVVSIFLVIGLFGFMEGVAFGLVTTIVFFVFRFSRVPVIRETFTAAERSSMRTRSVPHRKILISEGHRIRGYKLTGYLFFGSASALVESLKDDLVSVPAPDYLLLDFKNISGFDISAVNNFQRFTINAKAADCVVVITSAPDRLVNALKRNLPDDCMACIQIFSDLDHGLESCEDALINQVEALIQKKSEAKDALFDRSIDDLMTHIERQERFEALVDRLTPWLAVETQPPDKTIVEKTESPDGLYLLVWGNATASDPESGMRTQFLEPGCVVAAPAAFGLYSSSVTITAEAECQTAFLSADKRRQLESEDPSLAIALYRFLIRAEKG